MGDVGVLPAERGKGYGDLLVRLVLYKAVSHAAAFVYLECPRALEQFYAR
jgi:predicted acetyltransferase